MPASALGNPAHANVSTVAAVPISGPSTASSSRPDEVAMLARALGLEHCLWRLYCLLGDPHAPAHDPPLATRRAAEHRQHIIALRTRLAIMGSMAPCRRTLGRLAHVRLAFWRRLGRARPLARTIAATERALGELYQDADLGLLGRASRHLWVRLGAAARATPGRAELARRPPLGRRHGVDPNKGSSKHWAYARL